MTLATREGGAWTWAALATALAGPPFLVFLSRRAFGDAPGLPVEIASEIVYFAMAAFVLWVIITRERLTLESVGLRRPAIGTFVWAGVLFAIVQLLLPLVTAPLTRMWGRAGVDAGVQQLRALPTWFRILLAAGGPIEELFYRGFAIERLALIVGRRWGAGAIAAAAFGLAHIPFWGAGFSLAADLPFGIVMTVSYLWRRDLAANMLVHAGALLVAMTNL